MVDVLKPKPITGNSPSEFNARITLEYPSKIPDGAGGGTSTWVQAGDPVWAIISDFQSDEMVLAMQSTGVLIHKVRIRYRTDVKSTWRIGYAGKYWSLIGPPVDVAKSRRFLDLRAKETA